MTNKCKNTGRSRVNSSRNKPAVYPIEKIQSDSMKNDIRIDLKCSLEKAVKQVYPSIDIARLEIELALTKDLSNGDFFTNLVFKLAALVNKSIPEVGEILTEAVKELVLKDPWLKNTVKKTEFKVPGFINFFVCEEYIYKKVFEIITEKDNFGRSDLGREEKVQLEFVSANPTGPLSIAHGRQAAIGDALANVFKFMNYRVTKEYYINDEGVQIEQLGRSIWTKYLKLCGENVEFPENGYKGDYIIELAEKISPELKNKYLQWDDQTKKFFIDFGCAEILAIIKQNLNEFGVEFDNWFSQAGLIKSGKIQDSIVFLKKKDFIYDNEGALWLRTTLFGDDKDRVIVKSDKSLTYIASDIAYHRDKFERGFKKLINIWGPDHHGYIRRLKASIKALGYDESRLKILIVQLATLYRDGRPVPMSTRAGSFITLDEIIKEVGKDVARFFFLNRKLESHLDFDLNAAKQESQENPVYYIQYANARIASILDYAGKNKIWLEGSNETFDSVSSGFKLLEEEELILARQLLQLPFILNAVLDNLEPNILISYLQSLAKTFHQYYTKYRVVGSGKNLSKARILLVLAASVVIKNGLRLLGVSFPNKM